MKTISEKLSVLLRILDTEQQILQRSDAKATALLSTLGVFMVFFIVHFDKVRSNAISLIMVFLYFVAALVTIFSLLMVIRPKIVDVPDELPSRRRKFTLNPTFFGGISLFKTPQSYARYLADMAESDEDVYTMFSIQLFAVARINAHKNKWLVRGLIAFVTAITLELSAIIAVYMEFAFSKA